ncbi:hypothetical protein SAMN05444273_101476 [Litoreibacter ascidiaceicola]|uniref:Uncharacterized protein n=1 Tax=Litoreibacter ascidiaceicola TaxID=1486859 RepID=A0A1M4TNB6_9RHOB|nr:hypothetical protein SAMN05444273_101476 [Litoreibacter ascidiaceicola]
MHASRHITLSSALVALCAGEAFGLTPLPPPCAYSGDKVEGREITSASKWDNGVVTYTTYDQAEREYLYLEHCPSGKILRSKSQPYSLTSKGPRDAGEISATVYDALNSGTSYTIGDVQMLLRNQGVRTKRFTSKAESCVCQTHYPVLRGSKTPYKKDAK